ncbi:hypothetical protein ABT336_20080 [Micromonospora sp. NPDC000207]|uniref:hypothetical protein n=1 Tax=Micromonospora sp. NPDC000207 TaxID=3154246 RepID=UPI003322E755
MAITPDQIAYILTMVEGDHAANDEVEARLDRDGWDGFDVLLGAVFYSAVNRSFPRGANAGEIIRFVADMRSTMTGGPETDPGSAERLVSAALDPRLRTDVEPTSTGRIQGLTILYALGEGAVSSDELNAILTEAATLADRITECL